MRRTSQARRLKDEECFARGRIDVVEPTVVCAIAPGAFEEMFTLMIDRAIEINSLEGVPTRAGSKAVRNFAANLRALGTTQPRLIDDLQTLPDNVEWLFGRDGSLTAIEEGRRWWSGCSIPTRAAEFMLRKAELPGTVICFLFPVHAGQLRVALDRMLPGQALLALTPHWLTPRMILACEDFSAQIRAHRLYFAAGEQWENELDQLLEDNLGLPTPTQFIRPILADSAPADALVEPAQKIFAQHSTRRAQSARTVRQTWKPSGLRRICLVAPSHFRLWDDIGAALAGAMEERPSEISVSRFDPDDPASASPAAMAVAASQCDAIVTPNTARADLPDLVPDAMPWTTWLTTPRIPSAEKAGEKDTLLIADPQWKKLAVDQGWRADRIFVAGWPAVRPQADAADEATAPGVFVVPADPFLAIICDTRPLDPPPSVTEYSSHRLLWEAIHEHLTEKPFSLTQSPDDYLSDWMRRISVNDEGFDRASFLNGIVLHAWQHGVARALVRDGIAIRIFGNGWSDLPDFAACAAGPIRTREQFNRIVDSAAAIVRIWATAHAHPIDSAGKYVVRAHQIREAFLRDARLGLKRQLRKTEQWDALLCAKTILRALSVAD